MSDESELQPVELGFGPSLDFDQESSTEDCDEVGQEAEMVTARIRTFKDSVHGFITFTERVCKVIDTPHFQRLRNIKQLGTSYYVWPAASHNRFEHCLGVGHLAQMLIKWFQQQQPELEISDRDVDCVTIAGLCHDLGHGPWSHVWDSLFIPAARPNVKWQHEDASEMMFDDLRKLYTVDINDEEAVIIKALIVGDKSRVKGMGVKSFLFDIVANKRNGLDVDKFDYIARDSHAIGQGENVSLDKLLRSARVIKGQICYDIKDASTVYELCWSRFSLHKRIYNHKTAKAIEYMIVDALLLADPYMHISEQIDQPQKFLYLTDDIKTRIEMTDDPNLEPAQQIFRRIALRDLYKVVDQNVFVWDQKGRCREFFTPEKVVAAAKVASNLKGSEVQTAGELTAAHVIVCLSEMHYGMKDKNPLDTVKFYSKRRPGKALSAEPGLISHIMPNRFGEILLRVYTRDVRFEVVIQRGYRRLLQQFGEEVQSLQASQEDDLQRILQSLEQETDQEEPSTPRPAKGSLSRNSSGRFTNELTPGVNPFMKIPKKPSSDANGERSPSPSPNKARYVKRSGQGETLSPPRKRGRTSA